MQLKKIRLKNFTQFTSFSCEFDGNITRLIGINGSGKTTIGLTAMWIGFCGVAEKSSKGQLIGDRWRFISKGKKSADIELTLVDEMTGVEIIVKNHITKAANKITFQAPEGYRVDEKWLKGLLSVAFLSAKNFIGETSQTQALLLGIDVKGFDAKLDVLKGDHTLLNRDLKNFGEVGVVEKTERVDISKLTEKKALIQLNIEKKWAENKAKNDLLRKQHAERERVCREAIEDHNKGREALAKKIAQGATLLGGLRNLGYRGEEVEDFLNSLGRPAPEEFFKPTEISGLIEEQPDISELFGIDQQIANAGGTNEKAAEYEGYITWKKSKENKTAELAKNKAEQAEIKRERLKYISSFNFGVDNLGVDDSGGLLLDGRPVKDPYFSRGELELIVAKLHMSTNPELMIRFIDDFDLLDGKTKADIIDELLTAGFQIIVAEVGDKPKGDNCIVLTQGEVQDVEPEPKPEPKPINGQNQLMAEVDGAKDEAPEKATYLQCPSRLNKSQPRKPLTVCMGCANRLKCESFKAYTDSL